jgi:hypothetical protein
VSVGTHRNRALDGFGFVKWAFGGMVFFSSARADLMMAVIPDAPSECPTFGLTYSIVRKLVQV